MTSEKHQQSSPAPNSENSAEMAKLGITRRSVDYFHFGKYRYTDLKDAIAQARRQAPSA